MRIGVPITTQVQKAPQFPGARVFIENSKYVRSPWIDAANKMRAPLDKDGLALV